MTKLTLKYNLSPATQAKLAVLSNAQVKQTSNDKNAGYTLVRDKTVPVKPPPKTQEQPQAPALVESSVSPKPVQQAAQDDKPRPPQRTREERVAYLSRIKTAQQWLRETYPTVFDFESPKPLKRHIEFDLFTDLPQSISRKQLRDALTAWVYRWAYLQNIVNTEQRYDLTGNPVEAILPEHQDHARQQLERKKAQFEEQKKRRADYHEQRKLSRKVRDNSGDNTGEQALS